MGLQRALQSLHAGRLVPGLGGGRAAADQGVRASGNPQFAGYGLGEGGGLVEPALNQTQPVQGNGHHQRLGMHKIAPSPGHPLRRGADQILAVAMFQRQHQPPPVLAILERRAAAQPWPRCGQAVIAQRTAPHVFAKQRHPAAIANEPTNERRLGPAGAAERCAVIHKRSAGHALRRIDQVEHLANLHLPVPCGAHTYLAMTAPPPLFDRKALAERRLRAAADPAHFLHDIAIAEIKERLAEVNKTFTAPAVVSAVSAPWRDALPEARIVGDDEVLDLAPDAHDLVVHAMALHWANAPVGQLVQCRRALKPDGLCLVALLGGQTLQELRISLAEAEAHVMGGLSPRVAPMGEIRDLGALLQRAGLALPVAAAQPMTVSYGSMLDLMRDLRAMGETNVLAARDRRTPPRRFFAEAAQHYAAHFPTEGGRVRATFEMIYLTGWAPAETQQQPLRPGSATQRLADFLGTDEHSAGERPD